jgi:subtilisin family serine protease
MPHPTLRLWGILLIIVMLTAGTSAPMQAQAETPALPTPPNKTVRFHSEVDDSTVSTYIVQLAGEPLVDIASQLATSSRASKLDYTHTTVQRYKNRLDSQRHAALQAIQREIKHAPRVKAVYDTAFNGVALELTAAEAKQIANLPNVLMVEQEQSYELTTDAGPAWIEADQIHDGSAVGVFAATLLGDNLSPAVSSSLTGRGLFSFDSSSKELTYRVELNNTSQSAAIINTATQAQVAALTSSDGGKTYAGTITLTNSQADQLTSDSLSVLVKTNAYPNGEIGGLISGYKGEGIVVGIIDSGINSHHPSFAEVGGDGYRHLNPLGQGTFLGACDPSNEYYSSQFECNNKLIGAWTFAETAVINNFDTDEPSPDDEDGHGSHTASTAAGNIVPNMTLHGINVSISGVAPHANIIAYDVCGYLKDGEYSSSCPTVTILQAIDQAVKDKVDVINYSIGGGNNPWRDSIELAFLNARKAGIVVSTTADNSGPTESSVRHLSPWLLTTAATTHNRSFSKQLTSITAGAETLPDITGRGISPTLDSDTEIIYAGSLGNPFCDTFDESLHSQIAGKIVLCDRGEIDRIEKAENVQAAGGAGFILANTIMFIFGLVTDQYPIPGIHIDYFEGEALKDLLANASGPVTARISNTTIVPDADLADWVADFSGRGPAISPYANMIKPNIAAPGSDIFAALNNNGNSSNSGVLSGTSMASPHIAGAAALLKGLHPDWTPGEIQSALMTTAYTTMVQEDGFTPATPFDVGSGRARLAKAALAGLVMDETYERFLAADPNAQGDLTTLNLPSMANAQCIGTCSWTRTFRNTLNVPVTWTASYQNTGLSASPSTFTIPAGGTQTVTFTMNVTGKQLNTYSFNRVTFSAAGGVAPDVSLPVAVKPVISDLPKHFNYQQSTNAFTTNETIRTIAANSITAQVYSLQKSTRVNAMVVAGQFHITTITVPANTKQLIVDMRFTTAQDVDIYVYKDDMLVCEGSSSITLDHCLIDSPPAGTYQIYVFNYTGTKVHGEDLISYNYAIIPNSNDGSLIVNVPSVNSGGDLTVTHQINVPGSQPGDSWYGIYTLRDTNTNITFGYNLIAFHHTLGTPAQLLAVDGNHQSAMVNSPFATPLRVKVIDDVGNPLPNVTITFSAPDSGASVTFPSGNTAITGMNGEASMPVRANAIAGNYSVTASATGASGSIQATFTLNNSQSEKWIYLPFIHKN